MNLRDALELNAVQYARLQSQTRRQFLLTGAAGLGAAFLGTSTALAANDAETSGLSFARDPLKPLSPLAPQFAPRAKRVIYLFMAGAPSQIELFDYKPELAKYDMKDCPTAYMASKPFAFQNGIQKLMSSRYPFHRAGNSGAWISDRLPHLEKHIDKLCFIKSMHADQFNHDPAQLLMQTGTARLGSPSFGAWVTYGLGTENQNLPGFIVLLSSPAAASKQLWGTGFMPSVYQGIQCRSHGEPVLDLKNPTGVSRSLRRNVLDVVDDANRETYAAFGNEETVTRIAQYEMAFRMQIEASDVMDIRREPEAVRARYGADPDKSSFANNCLLARRLAENGVRFIQLYDDGWDHHGLNKATSVYTGIADCARRVDQPIAALLSDLHERGLLEDTLVIWGGEFGRTSMIQFSNSDSSTYGRDHNPNAFTVWMAGGGVKPGLSYGATDELGYDSVQDVVEVRDLHATLLYLLGFDHRKLTYPYQGLDQKLTGVKPARVVAEILA